MKKLILLFIVNFVFTLKLLACSYTPISFCATSESFSENLIVFGKIVSIDNNGIDFEIIDILKGQENKTIIRIWDGVDFDCNGNWSMSASELGAINETIIVALPKISEKKSDWETLGDYRRPDFFGYTPNLKVNNGIVSGYITDNNAGSEPYNRQADYEIFKNSWETNQNCSSVVLGTENYKSESTFKILSLSNNKFKILSNKNAEFKISVYNINGLKIESNEIIQKEFEIDLSKYSTGIYFVSLTYKNNRIQNFKIIKK